MLGLRGLKNSQCPELCKASSLLSYLCSYTPRTSGLSLTHRTRSASHTLPPLLLTGAASVGFSAPMGHVRVTRGAPHPLPAPFSSSCPVSPPSCSWGKHMREAQCSPAHRCCHPSLGHAGWGRRHSTACCSLAQLSANFRSQLEESNSVFTKARKEITNRFSHQQGSVLISQCSAHPRSGLSTDALGSKAGPAQGRAASLPSPL